MLAVAVVSLGVILGGRETKADEQVNLSLRYCGEMTATINKMVDFTNTDCFFGQEKKGMDFIFISSRPVFSDEAFKKVWLIIVVATFGEQFNRNAMKTDSIVVSDASMMRQRKAYRISSSVARELQRLVYNGEMHIETMYARVLDAMEPFSIAE